MKYAHRREIMKPKYLTRRGEYRTTNLFIETCNRICYSENDTSHMDLPVFTLKPEDLTTPSPLLSMPRLFVECGDVTGYDFAIKHLGSYEHFMQLCEHDVVGQHIKLWKEVIKSKMDSDSIKEIKRIATKGGSQVELSAAKYLANREYEASGSVGRPNKKDTPEKRRKHAHQTSLDTKKEMERLNILQ